MKIISKAAAWLSDLLGGGQMSAWTFGLPTYSGKTVTPDNALAVNAVWACVKILAETESGLPFGMYVRDADGSPAPAPDHPLHEILHDTPNPEMSAMDFRMSQMAQLALWGNCFSRIARNTKGQVIALWPLQSRMMRVGRQNADGSGDLVYQYNVGNQTQTYAATDILHVRTLSLDGINGIAPITQLANSIGLAMALEEYASRFFGNGAIPGVALEHPARLGPDAVKNIRDSWKKLYGGNQHAHEVAVLEEGMKIQVLGVDPQKAQANDSRKNQTEEIARIYRMPLHMIGDLDHATFSNIEMQSLEFVIYTLMPWLELWEQAINRQLVIPADRKKYFCEHNVAGLLRGDMQSRYSAYAVARQWGWMSVNDIRRLENMTPIPAGNYYLEPLNMIHAGQQPPQVTNAPDKKPALPAQSEEDQKATALKAAVLALAAMSNKN
jgi:HK97 family phage portal protein